MHQLFVNVPCVLNMYNSLQAILPWGDGGVFSFPQHLQCLSPTQPVDTLLLCLDQAVLVILGATPQT